MDILNNRQYLQQNKIADFGNAQVYEYYDQRDQKHCYIIDNFEPNISNKALLEFILTRINPNQLVAEIGGDAVLSATNGDILLFHATDASTIRTEILHDYTPRPYTLSFKTAEFHTYASLTHNATQQHHYIGVGPVYLGSWLGPGYIRDDSKYESKYFRGDVFIAPGTKSTQIDYASISTSFDLTPMQVLHLKKFISHYAQAWMHPEAQPFIFVGNNCSDFTHDLFKVISRGLDSMPRHYYAYHIADELDFQDKGIFYNYIISHPNTWLNHVNVLYDLVLPYITQDSVQDSPPPPSTPFYYPHATINFIDESFFPQELIDSIDALYDIYLPSYLIQDYSFLL